MGRFSLCRLLLLNDSRYTWFVLVPEREDITEIHQLSAAERALFWDESHRLSVWMTTAFAFDKLNLAALGNVVSQLHLHHVGRRVGDPAWPGPVWGHSPAVSYAEAVVNDIRQLVQRDLLAAP